MIARTPKSLLAGITSCRHRRLVRTSLSAGILVTVLVHAHPLWAGGFLIYNQDPVAMSQGLAVTAQIDNPSAIFYNPAAISRLEGTQASFGFTVLLPKASFRSYRTGKKTHMKDHTYVLPHFYLTHRVNEKITVGVGFFSPFGLATDWPDDWEGKFISTFAELRTFSLNPVFSWQLHPRVAIAFGVAPFYSDARLKRSLGIDPLPVTFGTGELDVDGTGVGYNLGLLWQLADNVTLGISYRGATKVEYDGDADFDVPPFLSRLIPSGDVSVDIDFPPVLGCGLSYTRGRLTLEFDVYWMGWSVHDEMVPDLEEEVHPLLRGSAGPIRRDYNDTMDYALGFKYRVNEVLSLTGGYIFDESPVPEETADPVLADTDMHALTAGFQYRKGSCDIAFGYYIGLPNSRSVRRNADGFNGRYKFSFHLLALKVNYIF